MIVLVVRYPLFECVVAAAAVFDAPVEAGMILSVTPRPPAPDITVVVGFGLYTGRVEVVCTVDTVMDVLAEGVPAATDVLLMDVGDVVAVDVLGIAVVEPTPAAPAVPAGIATTLLPVELKLVSARLMTRLSISYTTYALRRNVSPKSRLPSPPGAIPNTQTGLLLRVT